MRMLTGNLLGRHTFTQHMSEQFEAFTTGQQFTSGEVELGASAKSAAELRGPSSCRKRCIYVAAFG